MSTEPQRPAQNTDRELWRDPYPDPPGSYYANSIHVTAQGGIGINVGGTVIVKTLAEWHALVVESDGQIRANLSNAAVQELIDKLKEYKAERDRLTTENAELRKDKERLDWQPIDTAPKDGTEFMGGWSNHNHWATGTPMCWQRSNRREGWFMLSPTYENDLGEFFPGKWINARDNPTHWQPLPDPPKAQEGKKP